MYKLFSSSNSINEDNNILLNKINDLENENQNSLDLFNNYSSYRLGDGFYTTSSLKHWINNPNHSVNKYFIPLEELSETYSNSILSEYLKLSNYTEKDWDTLIEIVNNKFYRDININKSTDCLMHVRVGDVIDELCSGKNFLNKFYKNINKSQEKDKSKIIRCNYIKPLKYFQQKIKKLIEMGITKVYLMAGAHIKLPSYKYSTYYINKIMEEIEKAGLQVELKLGGSPDDDLLFSMNFDYFIPSEGQYCRLIKELNEKINSDFVII
jgi:DNA mismatch repair ATPase MutS